MFQIIWKNSNKYLLVSVGLFGSRKRNWYLRKKVCCEHINISCVPTFDFVCRYKPIHWLVIPLLEMRTLRWIIISVTTQYLWSPFTRWAKRINVCKNCFRLVTWRKGVGNIIRAILNGSNSAFAWSRWKAVFVASHIGTMAKISLQAAATRSRFWLAVNVCWKMLSLWGFGIKYDILPTRLFNVRRTGNIYF